MGREGEGESDSSGGHLSPLSPPARESNLTYAADLMRREMEVAVFEKSKKQRSREAEELEEAARGNRLFINTQVSLQKLFAGQNERMMDGRTFTKSWRRGYKGPGQD